MADSTYFVGGKNIAGYQQDIMKTVTLGLAPWIPTFSQAYGMEVASQTGGTIAEGFFTIKPELKSGGDTNWPQILNDYFIRASGEAEEGKDSLMQSGRNMNIDKMLSPLAQKLTTILDSLGEIEYPGKSTIATQIGEIETELGLKELEKLGKAYEGLAGVTPLDAATTEIIGGGTGIGSTEGVDVARGAETEILFRIMKDLFNDMNAEYSVGAEITKTGLRKEVQMGINKNMAFEEAYGILSENLGVGTGKPIKHYQTFARINNQLKILFENLPKEVRKGRDTTKKLLGLYEASKLNPKDKEAVARVAAGMNDIGTAKTITDTTAGIMGIFLTQVIDRFLKMSVANLPVDFNNYSYMMPVGKTGYMAMATFMMDWQAGYPQIVTKKLSAFNTFIKDRSITTVDLMRIWADQTLGKEAAAGIASHNALEVQAANEYFLSNQKMEVIDQMLVTTMAGVLEGGATDVRIDMWKAYHEPGSDGYIGEPSAISKILPSDMTQGLKAQFESIQKGEAGKELSQAMKRIFEISNRTTKMWKDVATNGIEDWEYMRGQQAQNQGIWTMPPWKGDSTDPTGFGPSMTPYISSQAGAAIARVSPRVELKKSYPSPEQAERVKGFVKETGWGTSLKGKKLDVDKSTFRGFFARG